MTQAGVIRVERRVAARPEIVYLYLTEPTRWSRWQGVDAKVDARPGGQFEVRMVNGMIARGRFVELVEASRVVFTWGWLGSVSVPPGSSTVEIDLLGDGDGTLVRLTHRGLPLDEVEMHQLGWDHYLPRLASLAEGSDPGPDGGPRPTADTAGR